VAAFITPADSALRNYASYIRQVCKEETLAAYSEPLQLAIQVFNALGEAGILYQADPTLPFTKVQGNPMVVDSISLPRDTLKRTTGDCDDLTVLFCSLLETAGVETAFITVPGHIYAAFNTKLSGAEYGKLHPDRSMSINLEGQLWVLVEITLIGRTGFSEAWRKGVEEWKEHEAQPEKRGFYPTRTAQEIYRPVGLKETDLGLQYGRKEKILEGFRRDLDKLIEGVVEEVASSARKSGRKEDYNKLGILYGQFVRYPQAEAAFQSALRVDPGYLNAQINLANLLFLKKAYAESAAQYVKSLEGLEKQKQGKSPKSLKVLLNLSRAYYQMERFKEAQEYYARATAIDERETRQYAFLGERAGGESRAASTRDPAKEILFVEDEE
jgi:Tfp pilus assembly protein PilF